MLRLTGRAAVGPAGRLIAQGGVALGVTFATTGPIAAQTGGAHAGAAPVNGVLDRSRPDYDALGIKVGGFTLRPSTTLQAGYDDNVYSTRLGKRDDAFAILRPRLQAASDWSRHDLALTVQGELRRFADLRTENSDQVRADLTGRLDLARDFRIETSASAGRLIEERGTYRDVFARGRPIVYRQLAGGLRATGTIGRIALEAGGAVTSFRYQDARIDGVTIPLGFRDYRRVSGVVRGSYALGPAIGLFAEGTLNRSRYPDADAGRDRSSDGASLLGGVAFGVTDLISGEVGLGYLRQGFDNPAYGDIGGLNFTASLSWNPTPLVSVQASASRDVERAPIVEAGGVTETQAQLRVDYELLRQLILTASAEHVRDTYEDIDRSDRRTVGRLGARLLINRALSLTADASHRWQQSRGTLRRQFTQTVLRIGVTVQR